MFFVPPAISFGQFEEFSQAAKPTDSGVSVLELSGPSMNASTGLIQLPQDDPFAIQQASILSSVTAASEPQEAQQPNVLQAPVDAVELEEPQILLRGPLHEAFADAHQADPQPNPIVSAAPPEAIKEVPPEFKPEGNNVEWIPGYWAWDVSQNDFIWISGVWRDVPPNQRWVPGYWEQVETEHRWIAGFWASLEQQELSYLPTPPANLDRGPSVTAPSDDYFYCPGNWEYQNNNYVWRTGHWQPRVANWIWIPARYIWTPRGCIYRPGYWDREFDVRGTLFAPVHFPQQQYLATDFSFQPNHCVNTGADFFVHLFVRPNCNHYFYGDWYGQNFISTGFRPWVQPQSHLRNYDPLLAHYNCSRYRQGSQLLISWVNNQHRHYHRNHDHRPRNTLQAQVNFTKSIRDHRHDDFIHRANLANRYDDIVRGRGNGKNAHPHNDHNQRQDNPNFKRNYVRTDRHDHDQHEINERLQREIRNTRKSGEQQSRNSGRNGNRLAQDTPRQQPGNDQHNHRSADDHQTNQLVNRNGKDPRSKINPRNQQNPDARQRGNSGNQDIARRNQIDLPKTQSARPTNRNDRGNTNGLTRAQIEKAQRDQEKANRKRELDQKIAAAKQQAEIKRKQRETARELSERQRQQELEQTRQKIAQEQQTRQSNRNQNSSRGNKRIEEPHVRSSASQNMQRMLAEQRRKQQQAQQQPQPSRTGFPKGREPGAQNAQHQTTRQPQASRQKADLAKQQRELANQQRDAQNRMAAERAKQVAQQKVAQASEASRQRDLQRQREKAAKAQADSQKRSELQARLAREKSQRDAERRAAQQRVQQKAQADAQRRAMEKSQRDAQRQAADQARRAADAAKKRQRDQEQAARRAKRKNK